jgi:hypothetical protein
MGSKLVFRAIAPLVLALILDRGQALPKPPNAGEPVGAARNFAQAPGPIDPDEQGGVRHSPKTGRAPAAASAAKNPSEKERGLMLRGATRSLHKDSKKAVKPVDRSK